MSLLPQGGRASSVTACRQVVGLKYDMAVDGARLKHGHVMRNMCMDNMSCSGDCPLSIMRVDC